MSEYIETQLVLDSLDIALLQELVKERIKELSEYAKSEPAEGIFAALANDHIATYRVTLKKLNAARQDVKRLKTEIDEAYFASLRANRKTKVKAED